MMALTIRASMTYTVEMLRVSKLGKYQWEKSPFFSDINGSVVFFIYGIFFIDQTHIYFMILPLLIFTVGTAEIVYFCVTL